MRIEAEHCPAYILAGGAGSRYGGDKARANIAGQANILRLIDQVSNQGHGGQGAGVFVVADRSDRYQHFGLQCLVDSASQSGPLAGLVAALEHRLTRGPGWLLLVGCDQVLWRHSWFEELATLASRDCDAVSFLYCDQDELAPQPIPAIYHTRILKEARQYLMSSQFSLRRLLASVRSAGTVCVDNPQGWTFNTQDELQQIVSRLGQQ
jgi:molybdopterin-guanine dinucleotide biosynthesis protein A